MEKQFFIGIDISKATLDVRLYDHQDNSRPENYIKISNDNTGFKTLLKWFKSKKIQLSALAVCMEHTGLYGLDISHFFETHSIDYCLFSGYHIKHSLGLVRGKDDNVDAGRLARYCYLHRDELKYFKSKSSLLLRLRELMSERRHYVKRQSQCKAYLTEYKNRPGTTSLDRYKQELKNVASFIKEIEDEILALIKSDSDLYKNYQLLVSIIGVALVNAANVLLYTNNFTAFKNARTYASYCGVAPFGYQSGTSINKAAKVSRLANKMLKVDLTQAASSASFHDPEMRVYYMRKLAEGKHKGTVLNAIKFKLIERMFAVVNRGSAYVKLSGYAAPRKQVV